MNRNSLVNDQLYNTLYRYDDTFTQWIIMEWFEMFTKIEISGGLLDQGSSIYMFEQQWL